MVMADGHPIKKKSRRYGHKKGASTAKDIVKIAGSNKIKYLTKLTITNLYSFKSSGSRL